MDSLINSNSELNLNSAKLASCKLRIKNLNFFNSNHKSKYNKSIISLERYIYYRDIFI